jgi:hypothetical protein
MMIAPVTLGRCAVTFDLDEKWDTRSPLVRRIARLFKPQSGADLLDAAGVASICTSGTAWAVRAIIAIQPLNGHRPSRMIHIVSTSNYIARGMVTLNLSRTSTRNDATSVTLRPVENNRI